MTENTRKVTKMFNNILAPFLKFVPMGGTNYSNMTAFFFPELCIRWGKRTNLYFVEEWQNVPKGWDFIEA